jgi:hypothetical protein
LRGIVLAVFPLSELAKDGHTEPESSTGGIRFTSVTVLSTLAKVVTSAVMVGAGLG